jgi:hypothetical protein
MGSASEIHCIVSVSISRVSISSVTTKDCIIVSSLLLLTFRGSGVSDSTGFSGIRARTWYSWEYYENAELVAAILPMGLYGIASMSRLSTLVEYSRWLSYL